MVTGPRCSVTSGLLTGTSVRVPKEVDPNVSESNILPFKKRSNILQISATDSAGSGGRNKSDVPLLSPLSKSDTENSYQASEFDDFSDSDSHSDIDTDFTNVTIPSLGGTNNKTFPQTSDQETEKRIIHRSPSIDASLPENNSSHNIVPIKTPTTVSEQNTEESIIADLPLPDLPPESSTEIPDLFKELPPINSRQTNSSLGGIGDSNAYTTINSKKRSLEDNETEIEVSRDTWNSKNMRSLEPPRSKKRIHLIAAVKAVKSIKPIRTTLRYDEAITYNKDIKEKEKYVEAYLKEVNQLLKMNTWDTDKYYGREEIDPKRVINSMFIFNKKRDGIHKARFVARGDVQHPDTYDSGMQSNTVHHYALMTSLSLALDDDSFITQLDISSAYFYADIKEELYIRPPPHLGMNNKLIRLRKSLYGLKQSGVNWNEMIKSYLIEQCDMEEVRGWSCVFKNSQVTICLFVDDMILFSKDLNSNKRIIEKLKMQYDTKIINLGESDDEIQYDILGLEIKYQRGKYMKLGMENSLTEKIPKLNVPLNPNGRKLGAPGQPGLYINQKELELEKDDYNMKVHEMQKLIGLAPYVGYKFRFDLLYYINTLAQHILFPSKQVLNMTYELIQFLWGTRDKQLIWHKSKSAKPENKLVVISDASYGIQPYYNSQIEAEIHAISEAIPLLNNLRHLIQELNGKSTIKGLLTDSRSTISIVMSKNEEKFKNRFFGTKAMRLRDEVSNNNLHVCYVDTKRNIADVMTKPLPIKTFKLLTNKWIH
ncbi:gag-pol fusion protein [Saccharomyces cerevisiae]|nr:gag-pol fusion protein [Saccharomyces cerevisiae]